MSHPLTSGRVVALGVVVVIALTIWWQFNRPVVTSSLVTIEQGASDGYDFPLPMPLLIEDSRDLARVTELLQVAEGDQISGLDLRNNFALVATSEVCAPYLRRSELTITADSWWIGDRPSDGDITDLYNLCEQQLVDFHIFEIDRVHLAAFADVPAARQRITR